MRKQLLLVFILASSVFCFAEPSMALIAEGSDIMLDFRFNNPGARATAMGGAFIGVADDATAAYTNPAGLTVLTNPESSLEFKSTSNSRKLFDDTGKSYEFDDNGFGVSFLGFAKPLEKATFALYRHELLNIHQETEEVPNLTRFRVNSELDVKATTIGAAFAAKLHERFSLGISVGFVEMDYFYKSDFRDTLGGDPDHFVNNSLVNGSDSSELYTLSLMVNPFSEFNIGLVYSYGPKFETAMSVNSNTRVIKNTINVPDVYGIGLSYRLTNSLTVATDLNHIKYSDLLDNFYYRDSTITTNDGFVKNNTEFDAEDTNEIHVGFEYIIPVGDTPLALRGGYLKRPEHSIHATGIIDSLVNYHNKFQKGEDEDIYSFGIGSALNENLQIDFAASFGDQIKEYLFSMVYRF